MTTQSSPLDTLARKRQVVAYGYISAGFVFVIVTVAIVLFAPPATENSDRVGDYYTVAVWSALHALLLLGAGCFQGLRVPAPGQEVILPRIVALAVGVVSGLTTALLGMVLASRWQSSFLRWINEGQTSEARAVVVALFIFFAGLVEIFFSLQLARGEERRSVLLRRLFYGGNALLSGLLLLFALATANIVAFLKLPDTVITTASAFKGLSDISIDFLHTLDDDITVYLIMPEKDEFYGDCRALLAACHRENPRIKAVPLSPANDADEIRKTMSRLKLPEDKRDRLGMIVSFDRDPEQLTSLIGERELLSATPQGAPAFQGENRLLTELNFLGGGGEPPVIYFTESNNELLIDEPGPGEINRPTARKLIQYLRERKYEVKPLKVEEGKILEAPKATMIVIAAPRIPFTKGQADLLGQYLSPKGKPGGKLVALLPAFPNPKDGLVSPTGLEELLSGIGVKVEAKRILSIPHDNWDPTQVMGVFRSNPKSERLYSNVRPLEKLPRPNDLLETNELLFTSPGRPTYRDDNYSSSPDAILERIIKEQQQNKITTATEMMVSKQPLPFGVAVLERGRDANKQRPIALVLGTDSFCNDEVLAKLRSPQTYIAQMGQFLDEVRERSQGMNIEPRALGLYTLPRNLNGTGLFILPLSIIFLGILALGGGVWITRRR